MVKIPDWIYEKWQDITNLLAIIINIPVALIMYTENEYMEVFVSSQTEGNPYKVGDKEKWYGLYCETVIKSQKELLIPNALKNKDWDKNPDIKLGMISYLGYPVNFPDNRPFGTICVLDVKENNYTDEYKCLLQQLKAIIENDLFIIHEFRSKEEKLDSLLLKQNLELQKLKEKAEENQKLLLKISENYPNSYISLIEKDFSISFISGQEFIKQKLNPNDFVGLKPDEVFSEHTDYIKEKYQKAFNGEETRFELPVDNQYHLYKIVPLYNENGIITRILSVVENITEQKKKELELKKAKELAEESDRLKTKFLHNLSHEIRTPMNGIVGFVGMLNESGITDEKRRYYSKIVQNSSYQLLKIIDDILEISTLETKQLETNEESFNLNDLLMELFSIFNLKSKERNIRIYLKKGLHDDQSQIISDKIKLSKILSNLLENALKFTREGYIELGYSLKGSDLILYVKDTGVGISGENQKTIFERFTQEEKEISRNHGGLGLGLSISKENAELLGGTITLKSEKGKGSTFFVSLPFKPANKETFVNSDLIPVTEDGMKHQLNILVAEDEEINYLYIESLLENKLEVNFNIIHARDGKEAVDFCKANEDIDIVLMDIKMPVMNGYDATEKIKILRHNLPVIAQTAYITEKDKELAKKHGCDDFITKPINTEHLLGLIKKYAKSNFTGTNII